MSDTAPAPPTPDAPPVPPPPGQVHYAYVEGGSGTGAVSWIGHMGDAAYASVTATDANYVVIDEGQYRAHQYAQTRLEMVGGALAPVMPPALPLTKVQSDALVLIDTQAEFARQQFLTPGAGQAMEYLATQADALAASNDPNPTAEAYPYLEAERQALAAVGQTLSLPQIASLVLQQTAAWTMAGAAIKEIRRSNKLRVLAATTNEQVAAILAALVWPTAPS